jgi:MFS family permease
LLALACLLMGPLSWPSLAWLLPEDRPQAVSTLDAMVEQARRGNFLGNLSLSGMLARTHSGHRSRLEFLVFSPGLLSLWTGVLWPIVLGMVALLWHSTQGWLGDTLNVMKWGGVPFGMLVFILSVSPLLMPIVQTRSLGRSLLLPGQWRRSSLPEKLFGRMLTLSLLGAGVILLPTFALVPLLGTPWLKLLLLAVLLLWSISVCTSLVFWRIPRRSASAGGDPVVLGVFMLLALLTSVADYFLFVDISTATSLAIMALAFALPVLLYRSGLKRWRAMEYGA